MMSQKALSTTLINAYISALLSISGLEIRETEYSNFRYTRALNMAETRIEDVPLYDFQQAAVNALKTHFIENDNKDGFRDNTRHTLISMSCIVYVTRL